MFKKIISALLIALMLTCVFVSCNNEPETPDEGGENTDTPADGDNNNSGGDESNVPNDNPQNLSFTLKSDDTYKVEIGKATKLSKIEIPATYKDKPVTELGIFGTASTEAPNTVLTEITIPDSIVTVVENAFYNCPALTKVNITDIEKWCGIAFANNFANPLYYAKNLYVGGELLTALTVPDSVTTVGANTFYNCKSLTSLTLHDGVTLIDNSAFNGSGLVTVDLGEGLITIGESVFQSCYSITDLVIPDSVETIGKNAFFGCSGIKTLDIGTGVTTIGASAFTSCNGLAMVNINDLAKWCAINFANNASNPSCYSYKLYLNGELITNLVIPEGVTMINARAFYNCSPISGVTLPSTLTGIGESAFQGCNKIVEVINLSIMSLSAGSTANGGICANAKEVHSGESKIDTVDGYQFYTHNGVAYLIGYTGESVDLVFPESYNGKSYSILSYAFYYNKQLKSVVISDGVTEICPNAFFNCNAMTDLVIGKNVKTIGDSAFTFCNAITEINIPDSVTSIGASAFLSCINATHVTLGKGVSSIGDSAFSNLQKATAVYITDLEQWCRITFAGQFSNPVATAKKLYLNGELLTEVIIPEGITAINPYAFISCTSINKLVLHDKVTSIGDYAFWYCGNLLSVELGESFTTLGTDVFMYCYKLYEVINHSSALTVTVGSPENGYIGTYAIEVHKEASKLKDNGEYLLYVTGGKNYLVFYKGTETELTLPESFNGETYVLAPYAFCNNTSITSITLTNGVTAIGQYAFIACSELKSITFSESVTEIGASAFQYCSVAYVNIPSVEKWCTVSFGDADANPMTGARELHVNGKLLTELVIPESVTYVSPYAFYYCTSLTSVTIHAGVTDIGFQAFRYCYKLVEVINKTDMMIRPSSTDFGLVARYAKEVHNGESKIAAVGDYLFYTFKGVNYLLSYTGDATSITLPESFNGQPYAIYDYAFYYDKSITGVVIPDVVTAVGNNAFRFCSKLETVTFGKGLTDIGTGVFNGCGSLTGITFKTTAGWKADGNAISSSDLSDPTKAVSLLLGQYLTVAWTRG